MTIKMVAFDGDDTLWHHDNYFNQARQRFHDLMNTVGDYPHAYAAVDAAHIQDLKLWGYGLKGFTLTMIDTAIALTNGAITGTQMQQIMQIGKDAYQHPVHLLPHVRETLAALQGRYFMVLITKGDLVAQEMKITRSGLGIFFDGIEIVSEKDTTTYDRILKRYDAVPSETVMIGNTLRSDVLPMVDLGGHAVHVPYDSSWHFENADVTPAQQQRFITLPTLERVPLLLDAFNDGGAATLGALGV